MFIPILYPLFSLTETATAAAETMCVVYIVTMPLKSFDISNITGVLRAGGDARAAAILDLCPLWLAAVPLTALTGLVLDAPIPLVCFSIYSENIFKMPVHSPAPSRKWINDVTIARGLDNVTSLFCCPLCGAGALRTERTYPCPADTARPCKRGYAISCR